MIERLSIKNYAIIDSLDLEFNNGFHVFSGETGAGKSIIVGALGLAIGDKGDSSMIRSGEEKAVVEAEFSMKKGEAMKVLDRLQIERAESVLVRREIAQNGKNRIFINGLQEPLSKLEELGEWLVDIHGQHDHQLLLNQKVHLDILDNFGKLKKEKEEIRETYTDLIKKNEEIIELEQDEKKLNEEKIFWENAVTDIEKSALLSGEESSLAESLKKMENAERLNLSFNNAYSLLYEDELSVSSRLSRAVSLIKETSSFDKRYSELQEILEDASVKIEESTDLITHFKDELDLDSNTMEETIDRLELIKDLKRKYKKTSIEELNIYAGECREKLRRFENRAEELARLNRERESVKSGLIEKSMQLSRKRQDTAKELSIKVKKELQFLGMEKTEFIVDIKYVKDEDSQIIINGIPIKISESGIDRVEFFIAVNPGEEPKPLKKAASGGEISRIMLALKSIFAENDSIETLIFDEIDVGIGGLTANNVAVKMKAISETKQVIVITHLAQIASQAVFHYFISKFVREGKTFTAVEKLQGEKRVVEIARMLGGDSKAAIAHAKEILKY